MSVLILLLGILLFFLLVVVHEWGHFIMARRGGVEVEEFGIGFPPRLLSRRMKGGWLLSFNLLPLGGFVKLKGEHDTDIEPGSLGAASIPTKASIMVAGVVMNVIAAYLLLLFLAFIGIPQLLPNQFSVSRDAHYMQHAQRYVVADTVTNGSPASHMGIKQGDIIVAAGPAGNVAELRNPDVLPQLTQANAGKPFIVRYKETANGPIIVKSAVLNTTAAVQHAKAAGQQAGYLGLGVYQTQQGIDIVRYTWSAPLVAAGVIKQFTVLTVEGLGKAIAGVGGIIAGAVTGNTSARQAAQTQASSQVSGPIGIFFVFKYGSLLGWRVMLLIVAILSLTLAIMNILPFPALDGGRLWVMLISRAARRPLSQGAEELIHGAGFAFLILVVILISIVDVKRFIFHQ